MPEINHDAATVLYACLALFVLLGYICSRLFWTLRLPPVLGMLFCGILFGHLPMIIPNLENFTATMQGFTPLLGEITFFLVLVRAGLEIDFGEVTRVHILYGVFPVLADAGGIAVLACIIGVADSVMEALCLGLLMACLGDGLVIPKMMELKSNFKEHARMPNLMFVAAPIEATVVLTLFNLCLRLASPSPLNMHAMIGLAALRLLATVVVCKVAMACLAFIVKPHLQPQPRCKLLGRSMFSGFAIEDMLLMVASTFGLFSFAKWCPNGLDESGLLQPELCAIMCAAFFGNAMSKERRMAVEHLLAKVWIVFSIILFTVLGTKVSFAVLGSSALRVVPMLIVGWFSRGTMTSLLTGLTKKRRVCSTDRQCAACMSDNSANWVRDAAFALIAGIPRATIQGALASEGIKTRALEGFMGQKRAHEKQEQMKEFAICTLAISAPVGIFLLDIVAKRLLISSSRSCHQCQAEGSFFPQRGFGGSNAPPSSHGGSNRAPISRLDSIRGSSNCAPMSPSAGCDPSPMLRRDSTQAVSFRTLDSAELEAGFLDLVAGMPLTPLVPEAARPWHSESPPQSVKIERNESEEGTQSEYDMENAPATRES